MPKFGPVKRKDLIHYLKQLGFSGPYAGGKHQFVLKKNISLRLPNPHQNDIGKELLTKILKQADISKSDWEQL